MRLQARELLKRLNLDVSPDRPVRSLRVGEQQLVAVAKALSLNARILILDEPTSALSESEIERLFGVMRNLKASGVTMLFISHKLDEVFAIADRVTVLRDGQYVGTVEIGQATPSRLVAMMVGRPLTELFPKVPATPGKELLRVEGLSLRAPAKTGIRALRDISFAVRRGEIVGVAGLMGAGRTELLQTIFGVCPPGWVSGRLIVDGRARRFASPRAALDAGLALVTEDRKNLSLVTLLPVGTNITLAALPRFLRLQVVRA